MKAISAMLLSIIITSSKVLAAGGVPGGESFSLMTSVFIGFGVLIVLSQIIPGIRLLGGVVKGFIAEYRVEAHAEPVDE